VSEWPSVIVYGGDATNSYTVGTYGCAEATRVALAQAGFFKMAAAVAVAPELLTDFYTLPAHALTVEPEDLELKRLAWAATAALCATDDNRVQVLAVPRLHLLLLDMLRAHR
jgi:hypothetical protein